MKASEKTIKGNGLNGWIAITTEMKGGIEWNIVTHGFPNSEGIRSYYFPMTGEVQTVTLIIEEGTATEKEIMEQHAKALDLFNNDSRIEIKAA